LIKKYICMNKNLLLLVLVFIGLTATAQKSKKEKTVPAPAPVVAAPVPTPAPVVAPTPKVALVSSSTGRPKNPFEIGISGGLQYVWGDVNSRVRMNLDNYTFGLHIRKALTNSFSWRLQYNYGQATMQHFMPHYTAVPNGISSNPNNNVWFVNSRMYSHTFAWDNILTIGNSSMYKNSSKWIFDLFAGPAAVFYRTKLNLRDANNNMYNWAAAENVYISNLPGNIVNNNPNQTSATALEGDARAKRLVAEYLDSKMDDTYESLGNNNGVKTNVGGYALVPAVTFGAAVSRELTSKFNASLEQRFFYVFDDYLDGERYANFQTTPQIASYSQMNDMISNTVLKLNYNLGKKGEKPLYWRNANEELQKKLAGMNPKKAINEAMADDDADGVPNILDQESASREGCPVDTKGIMLDSDKDGLLDCDDKEPYSQAGYPIDNNGVAKVPPPACCTELKAAAVAPPVVKSGGSSNSDNALCAESTLPSVSFDKDKFGMNSAMIPSLQTIGDKMQKCPDMRVVVNGINDKNNKNGKFNEQISYNRAMEVTNYLVEKFGVSRDRFIVRYNLEGTGDQNADRAVMFRNAQDGESGANNPPSPHPGLKAGNK
jgi:outer membrane protein OmpA-like peptidoglycan-associated protein